MEEVDIQNEDSNVEQDLCSDQGNDILPCSDGNKSNVVMGEKEQCELQDVPKGENGENLIEMKSSQKNQITDTELDPCTENAVSKEDCVEQSTSMETVSHVEHIGNLEDKTSSREISDKGDVLLDVRNNEKSCAVISENLRPITKHSGGEIAEAATELSVDKDLTVIIGQDGELSHIDDSIESTSVADKETDLSVHTVEEVTASETVEKKDTCSEIKAVSDISNTPVEADSIIIEPASNSPIEESELSSKKFKDIGLVSEQNNLECNTTSPTPVDNSILNQNLSETTLRSPEICQSPVEPSMDPTSDDILVNKSQDIENVEKDVEQNICDNADIGAGEELMEVDCSGDALNREESNVSIQSATGEELSNTTEKERVEESIEVDDPLAQMGQEGGCIAAPVSGNKKGDTAVTDFDKESDKSTIECEKETDKSTMECETEPDSSTMECDKEQDNSTIECEKEDDTLTNTDIEISKKKDTKNSLLKDSKKDKNNLDDSAAINETIITDTVNKTTSVAENVVNVSESSASSKDITTDISPEKSSFPQDLDKQIESIVKTEELILEDDTIDITKEFHSDRDDMMCEISNIVSLSNPDGTEADEDDDDMTELPACEVEIIQDNALGRPSRQAAQRAETMIRKLVAEEEEENIQELNNGENTSENSSVFLDEAKTCHQCNRIKICKYQILMHGLNRYVCSEECFSKFRSARPGSEGQEGAKRFIPIAPAPTQGVQEKPNLIMHHLVVNGERKCSFCSNTIKQSAQILAWETMEFCHEGCLGKYQGILGAHCANCRAAVKKVCLGKYSVRFGSEIKQFCSSPCLEEFKRGLKVCSYCQKDISFSSDGFLAPIGDKGVFRDFCSKPCMAKYESMNNQSSKTLVVQPCAVCDLSRLVKLEIIVDGKTNYLCSEPCFAAFKFVNQVSAAKCDMCVKYFNSKTEESQTMFSSSKLYNFCTKTCMNVYILSKRKIVPCNWCKVKKYNFDMIERVSDAGQILLLCSLNCLSLYQVSVNAASRSRIKCDMCSKFEAAQYHLTMSDATIRNFCSYSCVMGFQTRYTGMNSTFVQVPVPMGEPRKAVGGAIVRSGEPRKAVAGAIAQSVGTESVVQEEESNMTIPIISNVTSLAPAKTTPTANGTPPSIVVPAPQVNHVTTQTIKVTETITKTIYKDRVLVKTMQPKKMRNKSTNCRPITHNRGVNCRTPKTDANVQTDDSMFQPVIIPVPVLVYVPVPMHMYSSPYPVPVPFPLPIPVPIFIPTTKKSANGIMRQIKAIQEKIPADPFEAELLMMAEMVAEDKPNDSSDSENDADMSGPPGDSGEFSPDPGDASNTFGEDMLQMALKMAAVIDEPQADLEADLVGNTVTPASAQANSTGGGPVQAPPGRMTSRGPTASHGEEDEEDDSAYAAFRQARNANNVLASTRKRRGGGGGGGRGRGAKRTRTSSSLPHSGGDSEENSHVVPSTHTTPQAIQMAQAELNKPDSNLVLKYTYGVQAWKHWVLQKNTELEKAAAINRKLKLFKTDLLQLTPEELNYSLCLFIKEVRKPSNEDYAPDSIYYLCLGIQQYLYENGRIDNIFMDPFYDKFTECLDEVATKFPVPTEGAYVVTRIEEEHLWESKQLGAHSPQVLLNTLLFFNTRYFLLKGVDEHLKLSFSHVMKHFQKTTQQTPKGPATVKKVLLRFYPPTSMTGEKEKRIYEQLENNENPLRCPVRLYEFYLSKCPESMKHRNDRFYLAPERSCVPDSPVWYSTMALAKDMLWKMLNRFKMVKEINESFLANNSS